MNSTEAGMRPPSFIIFGTKSIAVFASGEGGEQVDGVARHRHELEHGLSDDGERALRAAEQVDEVEAGHVLAPLAAEPCDGAVGEDAFEREHLRARRAVFDDLVAARVLRDVAADERRVAAARVAGVEQPARGRGSAYLGGHNAWLRRHGEVRLVDFEDSVHLLEAHDDSAVYGKRAAPTAPCPRPRGVTGMRSREAIFIISETCTVLSGKTSSEARYSRSYAFAGTSSCE